MSGRGGGPGDGLTRERPVPREHPALRQRRRQVAREAALRRRNRLLWGLCAVAFMAVGYWALTGPLLAVHGVSVRGYDRADRADLVRALTQAGERGSVLSPPRGLMEKAVRPFPWVESVSVVRHWPRSLGVQVTQATPVALAEGPEGAVVLVSSSGRVLQEVGGTARFGRLRLTAAAPAVGGTLPEAELALLPFLGSLDRELAARVRDLSPASGGVAYARLEGGPELRLGRPVRLAAKAAALALVYGALTEEERAAATYIDLSVPEHPAVGGLEGVEAGLVDTDGDGVGDTPASVVDAGTDGGFPSDGSTPVEAP